MGNRSVLSFLVAGCAWLVCGLASGAGLVLTSQGALAELSPARNVELFVEVSDMTASIHERRSYIAGQAAFEVLSGSVVLHRSLPADSELAGAEVEIDGESSALPGRVLDAAAADELRRHLVVQLGDPTPLRELGQRLFVSDPVVVEVGAAVNIHLESTVSLSARGTLQALSVPLDWHEGDVPQVDIDLDVTTQDPLRAVYSPYHGLAVTRDGEHRARATYQGRDVCSRFDVTLMVSSGNEDVRLDLLPFRSGDEYLAEDGPLAEGQSGYVLGLLTPTQNPTAQPERDIVVAFDVSGSMAGEKLEQAKLALEHVVGGLGPTDTLSLVIFSAEVALLGERAQPVTADTKARVLETLDELVAEGGTNIAGALERAFTALDGVEATRARARTVVLLTDGVPTEGVTDVEAIAELAQAKNLTGSRVFTFGLGTDVNTLLLDRLAKDSGGRASYVREDTVADAVQGFFASISAPVVTRPELTDLDSALSDVFPEELSDLYAGRTQTFVARYEPGTHVVSVEGEGPDGRVRRDYELTLPEYAMDDGSVARLWALRQVGQWLEQLKVAGPEASLERDVLELARRFGVVTEFTNFRLDDEGQLQFVFSQVPTEAVGATAVNTSASISGYGSSETSEHSVDTTVRYYQDRNFPSASGYRTDAALGPEVHSIDDGEWTNLHFASKQYFDVVAARADLHFGGFASVGRDLRFVHLGRLFQVTDPAREGLGGIPPESTSVPRPEPAPVSSVAMSRLLVEDEPAVGDSLAGGGQVASSDAGVSSLRGQPREGGGPDRDDGQREAGLSGGDAGADTWVDSGGTSQVRHEPTATATPVRGAGCSVGEAARGLGPPWMLGALGLACLWTIRRRGRLSSHAAEARS